jgi:serine protease Do
MEVVTADGNRYPGKLVGVDPQTDLAVIKISPKERLPYLTFADSDKAEVGEWVVAIGAPRALEKTVTQGIISGKHRRGITEPTSYQDFLQTDAPINPGNSGGPLLNLQGEVVGVNAAIATESGGFEGIGFTIPSNMAVHVYKQLIAHGKVERGWLGVSIQNLTPELARSTHVENLKGAYVADVVQEGPADKAGIKKGDVIIAYDGKEIPDSATLRNAVAETAIGQEKKVTLLRDGKKEELTVKIGNLEESTKLLASAVRERLGITVRPVSAEEAAKFGLGPNQGVAIVTVEPQGSLGEAGFEVGDIILDVNGQSVDGYQGFVNVASLLRPKQQIRIFVLDHRTGNTGYVEATVR